MTDPVDLLSSLIRFDTTNPPGNERACIEYLESLLSGAGIDTELYWKERERPNLVARLRGRAEAAPLLLYGHADVVSADERQWEHAPFDGRLVDGYVWGRGAIDMKGGLAMMTSALLRARETGESPTGDVILAVVSDEETGGTYGSQFLVDQHADVFAGVRHAISEVGGFPIRIAGRSIYGIEVTQKQSCVLRLKFRGRSRHGALALRGGAMARMAEAVTRIERTSLPVHITPATEAMLDTAAAAVPFPASALLRMLKMPALTDRALALMGNRAPVFNAMMRNTVTPTRASGSDIPNVTPSEVCLDLDGRILPGYGPDDLIRELRAVVGEGPEIEVLMHGEGPGEPDMSMFPLLEQALADGDRASAATPMLMPGTSDARTFARLGIQTYGFTPMNLPAELDFASMFHGENERIPAASVRFGAEAINRVLRSYWSHASGEPRINRGPADPARPAA
ncbi:MAG: M20/M25/M40 family metallo-hydrolase [Chloroflexota bacterium]